MFFNVLLHSEAFTEVALPHITNIAHLIPILILCFMNIHKWAPILMKHLNIAPTTYPLKSVLQHFTKKLGLTGLTY
jgi:hypothetical protein